MDCGIALPPLYRSLRCDLSPPDRSQQLHMASLAACPRLAARAALARPLVRCSSSLTAPNWAPWPQRQQAQRDVAAAARNRLADLLADMREEEKVEETASSVPEGAPPVIAAARAPPPAACSCLPIACARSLHALLPLAGIQGCLACPLSHPLCALAVTKLEWQAPLGVLRYPDPRLRAPNAHVAVFDDSLRQLAAEMFEVMYQ